MIVPSSRTSWRLAVLGLFLCVLSPSVTSAASVDEAPEVVRLRVPEAMLDEWFPGRAGLTSMSEARFDTLVQEARQVAVAIEESRLIEPRRIEHRIRLEGRELVGKTLLRFPSPGAAPRWAALWPWSPAVEGVFPASCSLVHRDGDGRAFLRLGPEDNPGPTRDVEISWRLRPRVEAEGRIFDLELIEGPATAMILDLPEGITPSGPPGYREGPEATDETGRRRWRFDGPGGSVVLRLRSAPDPDRPAGPWIGGATLVELDGDGPARWTTAWEIDPGAEGHRPLVISLPGAMTWEEVIGPEGAVSGVEVRPGPDGNLLTVRWRDGLIGPTRLTLSGMAPIDDPGRWLVPVVEPVEAQWTGGPVVVWLDRSWSLLNCQERAGRRLDLDEIPAETWQALERAQIEVGRLPELEDIPAMSPEAERGGLPLAFFADRSAPVAELHLAPARSVTSISVQGTVRLREGADTMEAEINVEPLPGAPTLVSFELSEGWLPEVVRTPDGQVAPRWEQELLPDGRRLIRAHLPGSGSRSSDAAAGDPRRPELIVSASLIQEEPGALNLPRLRPLGLAIAEERWTIRSGPGIALRPTEAEGLSWLDPIPVSRGSRDAEEPAPLLSWQWIAAEGRGRVAREPVPTRPLAIVGQRATIEGDRLTIDWELQLDLRGEPLRTLPFRIRPALIGPNGSSWSLVAAEGQTSRPVPISSQVGDEAELRLPSSPSGPVSLRGRLELPWEGEGPLPMLDLPRWFETRGTVSLLVDPALQCETRGDLSFRELGSSSALASADRSTDPSTRLAESFLYEGQPGSLIVRTTPLAPSQFEGVILRANLSSDRAPDGETRHRLSLDVAANDSATLGITLPEGANLVAVFTEGRPIEPYLQESMFRIPLTSGGTEPDGTGSERPRHVVIDYEAMISGPEVEPDRPRFSMPCLSFSWNLAGPNGRSLSKIGPALTSTDPGPERQGWLPGVSLRQLPSLTPPERVMLEQLDELALARPIAGLRLGEALASWDVGRWPLVVDRSALEALGLNAETVLPAPPPSDAEPSRGAARRALAPLGLLAVPVDTVLLITSPAETPRVSITPLASGTTRDAWVRSLREAVAWGADRSDRFRTLERWRATSEGLSSDPVATIGGARPQVRSGRRFVAPGWPDQQAALRSVDRWPWLMSGVGLGLLVILGASVRLPGRGWGGVRLSLLIMLLIGSALVASRGGPRMAALVVGPFYAGLLGLIIALIRSRSRPVRDESTASTLVRSRGSASRLSAGTAGAFLAVAALVGAQPVPMSQGPNPIVAFLVDSGESSGVSSETVWLREADANRLREAAEARPNPDRPPVWPGVGLVRAEHLLKPEGAEDWTLESRLTLRFEAEGPAVWSLPVRRPIDLEATFDGRPRPVLIGSTTDRATVAINGDAGLHELVFRQRVRPEEDTSGRRLVLPVNPVSSAMLSIAEAPGGADPSLGRSLGPITIGQGGGLQASIGPIDRIEVRWEASEQEGEATEAPQVEALLLWRALPTSDLLDAQLTVRGASPVRELWFAIEPGLAVRSARAAGTIVEGARLVADDGDRWIARIDPPLPEGTVLQLELRRTQGADEQLPPSEPTTRRPPRFEPIGVSRFEGQIALMRPKTWGGRIEAGSGGIPSSEQEFEQDWGPLPRGSALDSAGAARFSDALDLAVRIGPTAPRRRIETNLQLDLDAGRWDWSVAARVTDLDGRAIREVSLTIPADLELVDVEAPGLTSWDRPAEDQLRLRFDGSSGTARPITLSGWLPQVASPMEPGPIGDDRPLPWPDWHGTTVEQGTLLLSSSTTALVEYRGPDGRPLPLDRLATSNNRRRYRPIRIDQPGTLRVESFPAVTVELWSQLVLGSRSARWEALVRYRVSGGPSDRIELILPEAWAEKAEYELDGVPPVAVRDRGDRIEIDPGRPIWGSADLRIRSVLPLQADQPLSFPDLIAWGLGTATGHTIALVVPTDRTPNPEYFGLAPADSATRDQLLALFPSSIPPDASREVYRVQPGGWSLIVQPPSAARGPLSSSLTDSRVELANLNCVIGRDGVVRGHAIFELAPQARAFLTLIAPPGAEAPMAVVDGRTVRPRLGSEGHWIIPLGDGPSRRVELVWIDPGSSNDRDRGRRITIPQPVHEGATVLTTIRCAETDTVSASGGATLPIPASSLLVERLERAADHLQARLDRVGPSSNATDRETITAEVARFLTLQRQAERSAYWAALMLPDSTEVARQRGPLRRIVTIRESINTALLDAGLAELVDPRSPAADPGPPAEFLAFLHPGLPRHFRAETEATRLISFDWSPGEPR